MSFIIYSGHYRSISTKKSKGEKLSIAKQDSFKKKLERRKACLGGNFDECEICGESIADLEGVHILDEAFKETVESDFEKRVTGAPLSINDAENGLLLCSNCHTKYDKVVSKKEGRSIQITADGTIRLSGGNAKRVNYMNLDGKKVPWVEFIGKHQHYPSKELLQYSLDLKLQPLPCKRMREIIQDELEYNADDNSSNYEERRMTEKKSGAVAVPYGQCITCSKSRRCRAYISHRMCAVCATCGHGKENHCL